MNDIKFIVKNILLRIKKYNVLHIKNSVNYKIILKLKNFLKTHLGTLMFFFIWGCAPSDTDPSLLLKSSPDLNPDINGRSSPLDVHIYQLADSKKFMQASFFDLYNDAQNFLGEDLLEKQRLEIKPNQEAKVNLPDNLKTKYLGILFAYQDLEGAKWRYIASDPQNSPLYIDLKNRGFQIKSSKDEALSDQKPNENNKGNE